MVSKTSEYQREYRPASLVKNIPTYYESLTYRHHRRELEFAHTPISWDFDQDSKCDSPEDDDIPLDKLKIDDKLDENGQTEKENVDDKTNDTDKDVEKDEKNLEDIEEEEEEETADNIEQNKSDVLVVKQTTEGREMTKLAKEKLKKYSSSENKNTGKLKPSQDKKKVTGKLR